MLRLRSVALAVACLIGLGPTPDAQADEPGEGGADPSVPNRLVEFHFIPTARAQIALWVESADGTRFETLRLTQAVSTRGIGNRPGATQMNSGFRWPYGRREGVLPVWAHRRVEVGGGAPFRRVIFQDRVSEGHASRSTADFSRDDYFCLSFDQERSRRDALDAVTCASVFNSDKGRYATEDDARRGYAEPWQGPGGSGSMRPLDPESLYPPRRDLDDPIGYDHPDITRFAEDARAVMPRLDAITMATPAPEVPQRIQWRPPADWPDGDYVAYLEIHTEGDYNGRFNDRSNPTPENPNEAWDYWAKTFGYPYRGQPSIVFRQAFTLSPAGGEFATDSPEGYGDLHGETGEIATMDPGMILDDPVGAPGSGADRLRMDDAGNRLRVVAVPRDLCEGPNPDPRCFEACDGPGSCDDGFLCEPEAGQCLWACDVDARPEPVPSLGIELHPDELRAHEWLRVTFQVPESLRPVDRYELRVARSPIVDEASFQDASPAFAASLDTVAVQIPEVGAARDLLPGDTVTVDIGQLSQLTTYWVALRAVDDCNGAGPIEVREITTPEIQYTTVSPCFVASAAWGTPLADQVGALRRFRDRQLQTHGFGRALVDAYYRVGPAAASVIDDSPWLAGLARTALVPLVELARWLDPTPESPR